MRAWIVPAGIVAMAGAALWNATNVGTVAPPPPPILDFRRFAHGWAPDGTWRIEQTIAMLVECSGNVWLYRYWITTGGGRYPAEPESDHPLGTAPVVNLKGVPRGEEVEMTLVFHPPPEAKGYLVELAYGRGACPTTWYGNRIVRDVDLDRSGPDHGRLRNPNNGGVYYPPLPELHELASAQE